MHFAMIGTRGVPARYGGFETAVEEIGWRLAKKGHRVTVYCRNADQAEVQYRGMRLVNLPAVRKRSLETLTHAGLSVAHALGDRPDAAVLFNAANAPLIPFLKAGKIPTAIHVDGLEWKRAKWAGFGAKYYQRAEKWAATSGFPLIADAKGISDHLKQTYGRESHLIPYGAPILTPGSARLAELSLHRASFHLIVARMEPENHVLEMVQGYAMSGSDLPLVVVGDAPYGHDYINRVRSAAGKSSNVRFIGPVWDQDLLNELYANCRSYLHGHSVGGTNPSLLRALGCGAPVTAFDVVFNREVTAGHARFFGSPYSVAEALLADDADGASAAQRGKLGQGHAARAYRWENVADAYETMLAGMVRAGRE